MTMVRANDAEPIHTPVPHLMRLSNEALIAEYWRLESIHCATNHAYECYLEALAEVERRGLEVGEEP